MAGAVTWNPLWYLGDYSVCLERRNVNKTKGAELDWKRERKAVLERGSQVAAFYFIGGPNYVVENKALINVKANQGIVKAHHLHDTFLNKTTKWIKTIYSAPEVRANEKACTKHYNWPHTRLVQRSSCFALVMLQKCSVFTSQFQTEDREGRKHLLPVEEVHFQRTNSDSTHRQLDFSTPKQCTRSGSAVFAGSCQPKHMYWPIQL